MKRQTEIPNSLQDPSSTLRPLDETNAPKPLAIASGAESILTGYAKFFRDVITSKAQRKVEMDV